MPHQIVAYNRVTALVHKGRATDIIYLDLCEAYDISLHDILVPKLERQRGDKWHFLRDQYGSAAL